MPIPHGEGHCKRWRDQVCHILWRHLTDPLPRKKDRFENPDFGAFLGWFVGGSRWRKKTGKIPMISGSLCLSIQAIKKLCKRPIICIGWQALYRNRDEIWRAWSLIIHYYLYRLITFASTFMVSLLNRCKYFDSTWSITCKIWRNALLYFLRSFFGSASYT